MIEQLGGKQLVMQLLSHDDPNVRYEALLAVQKLMVHNWYVFVCGFFFVLSFHFPIFLVQVKHTNTHKHKPKMPP